MNIITRLQVEEVFDICNCSLIADIIYKWAIYLEQ